MATARLPVVVLDCPDLKILAGFYGDAAETEVLKLTSSSCGGTALNSWDRSPES
jgi:hypothetical protein